MIHIREATPQDIPLMMELIHELALFEKAPEEVVMTEDALLKDGFGESPSYICFIAEFEDKAIGMALCYVRYSTWKGRVLYLEDLIIKEAYRNKGIGSMVFEYLISFAKNSGYHRLQWQVLDWNQDAIRFYDRFHAQYDAEWLNAWVES